MAGLFLLTRLVLFLFLPYGSFLGFGDQLNFYRLAQLPGWPFFNYWVEFPPLFPFLSAGLFRLAGGNEHLFEYILAGVLTAFDAGSILVFSTLLQCEKEHRDSRIKLVIFSVVLCLFPYGWWYFDPIAVFFFLLSIRLVTQHRSVAAGVVIAGGFLWKLFPVLALISAWMCMEGRKFLQTILVSMAGIVFVLGSLFCLSPEFTSSSLAAQYAKGSWQTIWALIDGNSETGNFGPLTERLIPDSAYVSTRNPSRIPSIIPLSLAGVAGLLLLGKVRHKQDLRKNLAVTGVAWVLLILASPGWSPQWILYIIPLILLVLPVKQGGLTVVLLLCISLAEWPLLFSRGRDDLIWIVIILRTLTILGLGLVFAAISMENEEEPDGRTLSSVP